MNEGNPELVKVQDVAKYLRVKISTVYDWAKKGKLPGVKVGRLWRFHRRDIDEWLEKSKVSEQQ